MSYPTHPETVKGLTALERPGVFLLDDRIDPADMSRLLSTEMLLANVVEGPRRPIDQYRTQFSTIAPHDLLTDDPYLDANNVFVFPGKAAAVINPIVFSHITSSRKILGITGRSDNGARSNISIGDPLSGKWHVNSQYAVRMHLNLSQHPVEVSVAHDAAEVEGNVSPERGFYYDEAYTPEEILPVELEPGQALVISNYCLPVEKAPYSYTGVEDSSVMYLMDIWGGRMKSKDWRDAHNGLPVYAPVAS